MIAYQDPSGWSALADGMRRAIVATLAEGPRSVGELAAEMPVTRPAVSQHLKVLREAGLVSEHQEGTRHIYQLNPIALAALRDQLDTYWRRALTNYTKILSDDTDDRGDSTKQRERKSHDPDPGDRTPARRRRLGN